MDIINSDIEKYIEYFYAGSSSDLEEFRLICEDEYVPIIRRETESFLKGILKTAKPKRLLEIGTGAGYSATVFAKTLRDCQTPAEDYDNIDGCQISDEKYQVKDGNYQITTIEMIEKRIQAAKNNFDKYEVTEQIKLLEGDASEVLKSIVKNMSGLPNEELFDFVFIDCAKSRYMEFFTDALLITSPGAIIVCDNVLLGGRTASDSFITKHREKTSAVKMRNFIDFLKHTGEEIETSLLNIGDGLTVSYLSEYPL